MGSLRSPCHTSHSWVFRQKSSMHSAWRDKSDLSMPSWMRLIEKQRRSAWNTRPPLKFLGRKWPDSYAAQGSCRESMMEFWRKTGTCGGHVLHGLLASLPLSHTALYITVLTMKVTLSSWLCAYAWCIDTIPITVETKLGLRPFTARAPRSQASPFSYSGVWSQLFICCLRVCGPHPTERNGNGFFTADSALSAEKRKQRQAAWEGMSSFSIASTSVLSLQVLIFAFTNLCLEKKNLWKTETLESCGYMQVNGVLRSVRKIGSQK